MARERNVYGAGADEGRWPSAPDLAPDDPDRLPDLVPDPGPDPLGRLDDVIETLEEMLRYEGPSAPASPGAEDLEAPGSPEPPEAPEPPPGDPGGPGAIPLLRDVVAPAADGDAGGFGAEAEAEAGAAAAGPEEDEPAPGPDRAPSSLRFEILPDAPPPYLAGLDLGPSLDPADPDAGGERYGDALPSPLDAEVHRQLVERLASEIDVIVQTSTEAGVKEALQRASAEITRASVEIAVRVREHLAITLPEIIAEIVRTSKRPDD